MSSDNVRVADPSPAEFAGDSMGQSLKRRFNATRPKFFPASVLPVLAGTAWGFHAAGSFDAIVFLLALFATVAVHAACNVLNDVGDESGGTDRQNVDRIYPYTGGSRFIQTGIMSAAEMARLGITLLALAAVVHGEAVLLVQMRHHSLRSQPLFWIGAALAALAEALHGASVLLGGAPTRIATSGG